MKTANRRVHSSIDKLPAGLRETLTAMIVDNLWPTDFKGERFQGDPRYEDMVAYAGQHGQTISLSAMGRFGGRLRLLSRMRQAGVIVRDVMKDLTAEKAADTQKAVAEMITAQTIDFISNEEGLSSKQIKEVAQAMRDCTTVAINADKYIRSQIEARVKAAEKTITDIGVKKNIDPEVLKMIKEQVYGIIESK